MDQLDVLLIEAWEKMSARLRADRVEAFRRFRRTREPGMGRPAIEFCLILKASDLRIDRGFGKSFAKGLTFPKHAVADQVAHELWLPASSIRELTEPVWIPWPGIRYTEAAKRLGMTRDSFYYWMKKSPQIGIRYEGPHTFGYDGKDAPVVWTKYPLIPGRALGRRPHPVWGHIWQFLGSRVPEWYELTVRRVPRWGRDHGTLAFRGWDFICPGRCNDSGEYLGCGRKTRRLYLPMPAQTIGMFLNDVDGFKVADDQSRRAKSNALGLSGRWHPEADPVRAAAARAGAAGLGFACSQCWKPTSTILAVPRMAWGQFIRTISGGLLYGKDVPMPAGMIRAEEARARQRRRAVAASAGVRSAGRLRRAMAGGLG